MHGQRSDPGGRWEYRRTGRRDTWRPSSMKGASTVDKEQLEEFGHRLLKAGVEKTD